mmetsp:Transcript_13687/g.41384  ORF Transcript_13687/g.41384 Transcript_13687/m.41384 type:complete len:254 (+) Transcript_13687:800-1561(+)
MMQEERRRKTQREVGAVVRVVAHVAGVVRLPVVVFDGEVFGDDDFPLVAVGQQLFLVVEQLLVGLRRVLVVRALHDRVHRTRLLAEAAEDALGHVDVVAGGLAGTVLAHFGLNRNRLGGADGFAELASDTALFARRVAAQRVLAAEPRRQRALFEGVVDRDLGLRHDLGRQPQPAPDVRQKQHVRVPIQNLRPRRRREVRLFLLLVLHRRLRRQHARASHWHRPRAWHRPRRQHRPQAPYRHPTLLSRCRTWC